MTTIQLRDLRKSFGAFDVIKGIDMDIRSGEFMVFVGPSGCGKSTLLRLICGLEEITGGTLSFDGETVNRLPPAKRGVAMVFQSYALYPHMTVFENMAFGMKLSGADKEQRKKRVEAAAEMLQLTPYLERLPKQLSGGQR
ncbi:ABC transporter ATP-binding protein, partial [Agrobacterium sp. S2]|nr:ABC transporter ATP-binding protein [Agrobacterium sp. S2]MBM7326339.1 ABC transporter ATP-binding protein [Agrobacterium sp. S2]